MNVFVVSTSLCCLETKKWPNLLFEKWINPLFSLYSTSWCSYKSSSLLYFLLFLNLLRLIPKMWRVKQTLVTWSGSETDTSALEFHPATTNPVISVPSHVLCVRCHPLLSLYTFSPLSPRATVLSAFSSDWEHLLGRETFLHSLHTNSQHLHILNL